MNEKKHLLKLRNKLAAAHYNIKDLYNTKGKIIWDSVCLNLLIKLKLFKTYKIDTQLTVLFKNSKIE